MSGLLLGIDVGTSVVKAAVFDASGRAVTVARHRFPVDTPRPGWSEADMERLWEDVAAAVAEAAAEDGSGVDALSLSAIACGAWLVDAAGRPLRPGILWNDGRAADLVAGWQAGGVLEEVFRLSGNVVYPGYTVPLVRWLMEHEPEVMVRCRWVMCCKDWIRLRLTGEVATDESDASYMPFDIASRRYSERLWDLCGVAACADRFPPVRASTAVAGALRGTVARALGLRPGIPVVTGMADVTATTLGAGVVAPDHACSLLGTSCLNNVVWDRPLTAPFGVGITAATVGRRWVRSLVNTAGTMNLDWFIAQVWPGGPGTSFGDVEAAAAQVPIGADGLLYHPYLNTTGVVSPFVHPHARAQFFGLSREHTRAHLARAVLEGVALAIQDCYQAMPTPPTEIRLAGGGARSPLWCQIIADCTGRRVLVPAGEELGALGAAMLAGLATGCYGSPEEAASHVGIARVHEPNSDAHRAYTALFGLYREVASHVQQDWTRRHEILRMLR
jgi:sugar (pentulose or hexulose) kinase